MKFGIFYEHQLPRPWNDGDELKLFQDALDQVELADKLGIDFAWEVEHHFLEEYSHSSSPEVRIRAVHKRKPPREDPPSPELATDELSPSPSPPPQPVNTSIKAERAIIVIFFSCLTSIVISYLPFALWRVVSAEPGEHCFGRAPVRHGEKVIFG